MRLLLGCVLAACFSAPPPAPPALSNTTAAAPAGVLTITRARFGPLDAATPATLMALRRALVGLEVRPVNDGSLQYDIYGDGERLAYVVPGDGEPTIFNVHAVSGKVTVAGRDWRVGSPFRGARRLTECECWGEHPTCFREGDHVAVNFERECSDVDGADRTALRVLEGVTIQRVIWSPRPFGHSLDEADDPAP